MWQKFFDNSNSIAVQNATSNQQPATSNSNEKSILMHNLGLLFFNIGGSELFLILLVVLLLFGSKKIPELARGLGKGIRYFKDATNEIQEDIKESVKEIKP